MSCKIDLTGKTFGRLVVLSEAFIKDNIKDAKWLCECSCGKQKILPAGRLKSGQAKSCGCLRVTHGLSKHPLYKIWQKMIGRCYNPKNVRYENYHGRGITVCERWLHSFENFFKDVSDGYIQGLQLDRTNNDGNYEPDNFRWVTVQQNGMNSGSRRKSSSKYKGVCWHKGARKWVSSITKDGHTTHLGCFTDEWEAAQAYNQAAKDAFGEYANLNIETLME